MFETITRMKLRFETVRGSVTIEDVWDMPLTSKNGFNLDELAKDLDKKLETQEKSFVTTKKSSDEITELKFEAVKYIIKIKLEEKEARSLASKKKKEKEELLELLADIENQEKKKMTKEEILKKLEEL